MPIEYLFLRIRAKAVGEKSEFKVTCPDDNKTQVDIEVNLEEVEVTVPKDHKRILTIDDDIKSTSFKGLVIRSPLVRPLLQSVIICHSLS